MVFDQRLARVRVFYQRVARVRVFYRVARVRAPTD